DGFGDLDAGFWGAGRLTTGASGEGSALFDAVVAYDLTRDARRPDGTLVYTPEMQQSVVHDLLLAGCADLENYNATNNKSGPGRALSGAIGILFGQPERVRRALEGFERLLDECFHFDGFCMESPAYSGMHLSLMEEIPEMLEGYSDPPGYQPPQGERLQNFDPFRQLPRYRLALESMVRMSRPDLYYPVIGDTTAGARVSPHWVEILATHYGDRYAGLLETLQGAPLEQKGSEYALWHRDPALKASTGPVDVGLRSEYFPGWQVGVLRAGGGPSQTAFYFNGYREHGHRHADTLGIIYHAFNKELASDRGYIWDDPRNAWTKSTLAHNIVGVDGGNQNAPNRRSQLELFALFPDLEVIQASAAAYTQCTAYRRTCALVPLPNGESYVVDLFRVQGGTLHQYAFHGNGTLVAPPDGPLVPLQEKLSWLTNLRQADAPAGFTATWEFEGVKMRLMMETPLQRLLVTDAPGWRSYRGDQLNAPPITQVVAERRGAPTAESLFTAVICAFKGDACPVREVRSLVPNPPTNQAAGVQVTLAGR
ncbi:MAG: heparinase II/III family protein, partial [Armatimonadota bacterium]|nr:heparinase II/III family protein [Armatimonadota bacterium]